MSRFNDFPENNTRAPRVRVVQLFGRDGTGPSAARDRRALAAADLGAKPPGTGMSLCDGDFCAIRFPLKPVAESAGTTNLRPRGHVVKKLRSLELNLIRISC